MGLAAAFRGQETPEAAPETSNFPRLLAPTDLLAAQGLLPALVHFRRAAPEFGFTPGAPAGKPGRNPASTRVMAS